MKKRIIFIFAFLMLFLNVYGFAEQTEEEYEEGLFIYTPVQGKLLPWVETENGNEYQIIGLAPPDKTVKLTLRSEGTQVWENELIAEGNGYFHAEIPADQMDAARQYTLNAVSAAYETNVEFKVYSGTLSDFARDPLHLEMLSDLTEEEKAMYELDMEEVKASDSAYEDSDENDIGQATVQTGPNEFRTKDYSYLVKDDGTVTLIYYYGHERNLILPESVDGYTVSSLDFANNNLNGVATITIPSGISEIKNKDGLNGGHLNAIYVPRDHPTFVSVNGILYTKDLRELVFAPSDHPDKDMTIPNGTTRVARSAFFKSKLRHVDFPDSLKRIGDSCFAYAGRLRSVDIPDNVRILETGCFRGSGIRRIIVPSRAAVMEGICHECRNLEEIVVMPGNENVKSVDGVLFSADGETLMTYPAGKEGKNYTVPAGTVVIAEYAFAKAENLKEVTFSDSVNTLGDRAFWASSVESIVFPDSLVNIGNSVFNYCHKLERFVVPGNHSILDAVEGKYLYSKDHKIFYCYPGGLREKVYVVEDGTEEIAPQAFSGALLSEIHLPEGLKRIGNGAFFGTTVKSIYIPGTVEIIDLQAFAYCDQLETVAIGKGVQTIGKYAFERTTALKGVSVPESVKDIRELAFLGSGNVRIFTVENSFAHQYALQNQLQYDVKPGNYELFTESVKEETDPMRSTGYAPRFEVVILQGSTVNIREKPSMDSRRVGRGEPGNKYTWLETVESKGVTWYKVELEDGTTGYIHSNMAELVE